MRAREFTEGCLFLPCDAGPALRTYRENGYQAYRRHFPALRSEGRAVEGRQRAIGGAASQEFMVDRRGSARDLILSSADGRYAATRTGRVSLERRVRSPWRPVQTLGPVSTPAHGSIEGPSVRAMGLRAQPDRQGAAAAGPFSPACPPSRCWLPAR